MMAIDESCACYERRDVTAFEDSQANHSSYPVELCNSTVKDFDTLSRKCFDYDTRKDSDALSGFTSSLNFKTTAVGYNNLESFDVQYEALYCLENY